MKLGILGAGGKMGREIISAALDERDIKLVGASEVAAHPNVGKDVSLLISRINPVGVKLSYSPKDFIKQADVLIDVTTPSSCIDNLKLANEHGTPIVICVTGFDDSQLLFIKNSAKETPVLQASNTSLGIHLVLEAIKNMSKALSPDKYDAEVVDQHHRKKVDGPSGTAMAMASAVEWSGSLSGDINSTKGRYGIKFDRAKGEIGFSVIRGGGVFAEHSILFIGEDEKIEIRHEAFNRRIFANGAINAAKWMKNKPVGFYEMSDVFGLNEKNERR